MHDDLTTTPPEAPTPDSTPTPPPPTPPFRTRAGRQSPPPPRREIQMNGCLIAFLAVLGTALIAFVCFCIMIGNLFSDAEPLFKSSREHQVVEELLNGAGGATRKIAVVDVKGVIHSSSRFDGASSEAICEQLKRAGKDTAVVAIILDMNTPGGEVTASDEVYHAVRALRAQGKPVITCMRSVAASGGYLVAAGTDWIVANRLTLTGSVGVLMGTVNYAELFEKVGLKSKVFTSGQMKDMLNGGREWNQAELDYVQSLVEATFTEFVAIVAKGRGFASAEEVRASEFADGRVLTGARAHELKLVDELGYFETAVEKARALSESPDAKVVRYRRGFRMADLLFSMEGRLPGGLTGLLPEEARCLKPGRLYYLMPTAVR